LSNSSPGGNWTSSATNIATVSATGIVTGVAEGDVVISYTVTNASGCLTTVTTMIRVAKPQGGTLFVIEAFDDDYSSTPFNAAKENVLEVLNNDKVNNGPVNLQNVVVTIVNSGGIQGITIDSQGRVVVPQGIGIGTYTITYAICHNVNPSNCSTAIITIVLKEPCDFDDSAVDCDIVVRNGMSPDNDGLNDVFVIDRIENYPDNTVEIYNRWGQLVFTVNGYDNSSKVFVGISEGRSTINKNAYLPSGTYYYVIKYKKPISGVMKQKAGFLYISI
jgi:gliding motility-associated-like protein